MFYTKYPAIHKVQMHSGAIRKLLNGLCICTGDNPLVHLLAPVDYLPAQKRKPNNNLHSHNDFDPFLWSMLFINLDKTASFQRVDFKLYSILSQIRK